MALSGENHLATLVMLSDNSTAVCLPTALNECFPESYRVTTLPIKTRVQEAHLWDAN